MAAMGAIVTMLNQKGGGGKTAVTLGLASAAMEAGRRVLVVDLDPQGSSTWVLADPDLDGGRAAPAVDRLLSGGGTSAAARAVTPSAWGDGVDVVPSRPDLARWEHATGRDATRLRTALLGLIDGYDAILVDCPPSLGHLTRAGLAAADLAVIVVEPSALGLRGVNAVADTIDGVWEEENPDLDLAGVIVNKVPGVSAEGRSGSPWSRSGSSSARPSPSGGRSTATAGERRTSSRPTTRSGRRCGAAAARSPTDPLPWAGDEDSCEVDQAEAALSVEGQSGLAGDQAFDVVPEDLGPPTVGQPGPGVAA
jgi:chromosome partitioning protein